MAITPHPRPCPTSQTPPRVLTIAGERILGARLVFLPVLLLLVASILGLGHACCWGWARTRGCCCCCCAAEKTSKVLLTRTRRGRRRAAPACAGRVVGGQVVSEGLFVLLGYHGMITAREDGRLAAFDGPCSQRHTNTKATKQQRRQLLNAFSSSTLFILSLFIASSSSSWSSFSRRARRLFSFP